MQGNMTKITGDEIRNTMFNRLRFDGKSAMIYVQNVAQDWSQMGDYHVRYFSGGVQFEYNDYIPLVVGELTCTDTGLRITHTGEDEWFAEIPFAEINYVDMKQDDSPGFFPDVKWSVYCKSDGSGILYNEDRSSPVSLL